MKQTLRQVRVGPCRSKDVEGGGEVKKSLVQEAQSKGQAETNLLLQRQLHPKHHWQGDQEDQEVGGDVEADESPHDRSGRLAAADAGVPIGGEGGADDKILDETEDVVADDHDQHAPRGPAGVLVLEHADVEKQDGNLGRGQAELVQEAHDPLRLSF